jgi:hypothetical protein
MIRGFEIKLRFAITLSFAKKELGQRRLQQIELVCRRLANRYVKIAICGVVGQVQKGVWGGGFVGFLDTAVPFDQNASTDQGQS